MGTEGAIMMQKQSHPGTVFFLWCCAYDTACVRGRARLQNRRTTFTGTVRCRWRRLDQIVSGFGLDQRELRF